MTPSSTASNSSCTEHDVFVTCRQQQATGKDPDGQVTYGDTDELRPPLPPPVVVQDEVRLPLTVTGANGSSSSSNSRKLKFNRSSSLGSNSNSNSRSQRNNVDDNGNSNDGNPKFHRSCSMGSNSNYRSHRNNVEDNSNGNDGTPKKDVEKVRCCRLCVGNTVLQLLLLWDVYRYVRMSVLRALMPRAT